MTNERDAHGALMDLSDALAAAVERAGRATVTVDARRRFAASGVLWAPGVVVTCDHVIEREEPITVRTASGASLNARIAGRDPGTDLAVLRIDGGDVPVTEPAPAGSARPGHLVLAVGRPSAEGVAASFGVISTVGGPWRTFRGGQVDGYLRSDTTFYPGFSGGPLADVQGRLVGINSSRLGRGAGLTLPVAAVRTVVDALLASGRIRRGYLGIGSQPVRLPDTLAAKAGGQESGLLIVNVESGSPAAAGGAILGDIIVGMGGMPVRDTDDLQAALTAERVGQPLAVTVLRGGERLELSIVVGERR